MRFKTWRVVAFGAPLGTVPPGTLPPGTVVHVGDCIVTVERFLSEGGFAHVTMTSTSLPTSATPRLSGTTMRFKTWRVVAFGAPSLPPGTVVHVGDCIVTVERFLSEGGFAHVYLATSTAAAVAAGLPGLDLDTEVAEEQLLPGTHA
jgi:hypothetical protein